MDDDPDDDDDLVDDEEDDNDAQEDDEEKVDQDLDDDEEDDDDEDTVTYCHQYFFLNLLEDCWNIELLASKVDALHGHHHHHHHDHHDHDNDHDDYVNHVQRSPVVQITQLAVPFKHLRNRVQKASFKWQLSQTSSSKSSIYHQRHLVNVQFIIEGTLSMLFLMTPTTSWT